MYNRVDVHSYVLCDVMTALCVCYADVVGGRVLWCYGVMMLWCCGVMVLWCYGVMMLPSLQAC